MRRGEAGFAMLLVFALAGAIAIMLYRQLPRVAFESQRAKEELLIERGEQYKRAIQLFVRKEGRYPANLDQLESTNNRRYLRRRYPDPLTGKTEWRLVHIGPGGVFTDSLIHKPKTDQQEQKAQNTFVSEFAGVGQTAVNPGGATAVPRRRESEGGAPSGMPGMPGMPPGLIPGQAGMPGMAGMPPSVPGQEGQTLYPGQQPGQMPPGGVGQPVPVQQIPGMPAGVPPGVPIPGVPGQPGQVYPQMYPIPGVPYPVQPGAQIPGQPGTPMPAPQGAQPYPVQPGQPYPVQPGQPFPVQPGQPFPVQPGQPFPVQPGQPLPVQPGQPFPGQPGQPIPVQPGQPFPVQPGQPYPVQPYPAQPGQPYPVTYPTVINQPPPGAAQAPVTSSPYPGAPQSNPAAVEVIRNLLTTPRPGGMPGAPSGMLGMNIQGGVAGVASTVEKSGIKVYNERSKYNEWEFLYDLSQDRKRAGMMPGMAPGQGTGAATDPQPGNRTPGFPPVGGFPPQGFPPQGGVPPIGGFPPQGGYPAPPGNTPGYPPPGYPAQMPGVYPAPLPGPGTPNPRTR
jgi:hypothetical protein